MFLNVYLRFKLSLVVNKDLVSMLKNFFSFVVTDAAAKLASLFVPGMLFYICERGL
jgi:hypothetical protein